MQLSILSIAYPFAPVTVDAVGGAEQILSRLDHALVASGHRSLVVGCSGSQSCGELVPFSLPHQLLDEPAKSRTRSDAQAAIDQALATHAVDLVHLHGMDAWELPPEIPVVITLHLPVSWYPRTFWETYADRAHFCFVSESQRRSCQIHLYSSSVIENGVPFPSDDSQRPRKDFALVLGRVCPEKNAHAAFQAGTLAGTRVLLGGAIFPYPEHQQYFRTKIQPQLTANQTAGPRHVFLGPLSRQRTQQLLARAKCLLHPTLAPETSSLVAMEALASGTPVIAYRSGALPQIIDHGSTGFLVDSVEEMAEALHHVHTISPNACRQVARNRFSLRRMIDSYMQLYQSVERGEPEEAECLAA